MANNRRGNRPPREFFTLGEHPIGEKLYRFQYDGRVYRILEVIAKPEQEPEETILLEESESREAYDAWNHIKRPERFGGVVVFPEQK